METPKNPEPPDDGSEKPKKQVKANLASKDADLSTQATTVSDAWLSRPDITLIWKTANDFKDEVAAYNASLSSKGNTSKDRPRITHDLQRCNDCPR